jgi:hypothetical protein
MAKADTLHKLAKMDSLVTSEELISMSETMEETTLLCPNCELYFWTNKTCSNPECNSESKSSPSKVNTSSETPEVPKVAKVSKDTKKKKGSKASKTKVSSESGAQSEEFPVPKNETEANRKFPYYQRWNVGVAADFSAQTMTPLMNELAGDFRRNAAPVFPFDGPFASINSSRGS